MMLMLLAIRNAWDLITWMRAGRAAERRRGRRQRTEPQVTVSAL